MLSKRLRWWFSACIAIGAAVVCALFVQAFWPRTRGPVLSVDRTEIHVSEFETAEFRKHRKKASGTFHISNTGDLPLKVNLDYATCQCAVESFGRERVLNPGETAPLEIQLSLPPAGTSTAAVQLLTNSNATPSQRLRLIVDSDRKPPYVREIVPATVNFWSTGGTPVTQQVRVVTVEEDGKPWIQTATTDVPGLTIDGPRVSEAVYSRYTLRTYHFDFRLNPSTTGKVEGNVLVYGSLNPTQSIADFRVQGMIGASVQIVPNPVIMNISDSASRCSKRLLARATPTDFDLELKVKAPDVDWLKVQLGRKLSSSTQVIDIEITGNQPDLSGPLELVFETNHPECSVIRVPLYLGRTE